MSAPSQAELDALVAATEAATAAWMRGDMDRYLELTPHHAGFTLFNPFGGPAASYDERDASIRASAGFFRNGDARLEVAEVHAWEDTVVLVMVERQHGEVGGLPDQDWSIRVTQVLRRAEDGGWALVHRHADPLVRPVGLEQASALARGG